MKALVYFAIAKFGRIDILHNKAGAFGMRGYLFETEDSGFDFTFALLT